MVDQAIWSKKMSNGVRRTPVSAEQVCIMMQTQEMLQYFQQQRSTGSFKWIHYAGVGWHLKISHILQAFKMMDLNDVSSFWLKSCAPFVALLVWKVPVKVLGWFVDESCPNVQSYIPSDATSSWRARHKVFLDSQLYQVLSVMMKHQFYVL